MTKYIYHGDSFTSPELKGKTCTAVRRKDGKCYRSRLGTMLVEFEEGKHIVLARRLRKVKQTCNENDTLSKTILAMIDDSYGIK